MKSKVILSVVLLSLCMALFVLWQRRGAVKMREASDRPTAAAATAEIGHGAERPTRGAASLARRLPPIPYRPGAAVPAPAVSEASPAAAFSEPGRDGYYDRLLAVQGRDSAKEADIAARMQKRFGEKPDTLVGATACSSEFCRVELRGVGKVDFKTQWHSDIVAAVEPKGLTFFIVDDDGDGNTVVNCYFGRKDSWTVPDFYALGML